MNNFTPRAQQVLQLARQGTPVPLVKFVDDWWGMATVKAASPQTLIMARKTFGLELELVGGLAEMSDSEIEQHAAYLMNLLRQKCLQEAARLQYIDCYDPKFTQFNKVPDILIHLHGNHIARHHQCFNRRPLVLPAEQSGNLPDHIFT